MADVTVVELRQYTLHPGKRDILIDLFDAEFIETQEELGIEVIGQFRDLDDPDRFVWLRGYPDLPTRAKALPAFYYDGPAWKQHSATANATMVDSSNALLLRPLGAAVGYPSALSRPPVGAEAPPTVVIGSVYHRQADDDGFAKLFDTRIAPVLADTGAAPVVWFETLAVENDFPALPVRDETVFAWFAVLPDDAAYDEHRRALQLSTTWQRDVLPQIDQRCVAAPQQLRLRPSARSLLGMTTS